MAKIVEVINTMISNEKKITDVVRNEGEYYFCYNIKHLWSIRNLNDEYYLHYYPIDNLSTKDLAGISNWEGIQFVTYASEDIKTTEAVESFRELYQIVSGKVFGIDEIFNEIING